MFQTDSSRTLRFLFFCQCFFTVLCSRESFAHEKYVSVTLPALTIGHEGALRLELRVPESGVFSLEWTEWGGENGREELSYKENKDKPRDFLRTRGKELALGVVQYSNPENMSGFHIGISVGYRALRADWQHAQSHRLGSINTEGLNKVHADGSTFGVRTGYRFVGEERGFSIGVFAGAKYFLMAFRDRVAGETAMAVEDKGELEKKLRTLVRVGVDFGWTF